MQEYSKNQLYFSNKTICIFDEQRVSVTMTTLTLVSP